MGRAGYPRRGLRSLSSSFSGFFSRLALAALLLVGAAGVGSPAIAQTTHWTATLTADEVTYSSVDYFGCDNGDADQDNCSLSTVLTDDDFTYDSATYTVRFLFWNSSDDELTLGFDGLTGSATKTALSSLALEVDGTDLLFSSASIDNSDDTYVTWTYDPATDWEDGTEVALKLKTPNNPPTASNGEVETDEDEAYTFQASDFNFADTDSSDTLASVKIVTLPGSGKGTLEIDGTAIGSTYLPETVGSRDLGTDKGLVYVPPDDANGNDYTTFTFRVNDGTNDSANIYTMTIDVDSVPDVTQVAVTSTPKSGTTPKKYGEGEEIQVTVTFDEAVTVTGDPHVDVQVGGNERDAAYASGSGATDLVFEYTVAAADRDSDGISIAADDLKLDANDKIRDADDHDADVTHAALAAQSAHKVDGSLTPPTLPTSPTGLTAVAGNAMVKLAWTAPEEAGTSPVTGYEYQRKEGGGSYGVWTATDHDLGVHQTVTGLNNNTAYTFRVRAVNAVGAGQESAEASATPNTDFRPVIAGDSTAEQATTFRITITFDRDVPELRRKALVVRGGKLVEVQSLRPRG